jgi:hypothetical protein
VRAFRHVRSGKVHLAKRKDSRSALCARDISDRKRWELVLSPIAVCGNCKRAQEREKERTKALDFSQLKIDWVSTERRFWAKVDKSLGPKACWAWQGARYRKKALGYGYVNKRLGPRKEGRIVKLAAHRLAYWFTYGAIDPQALILHSCHNPQCVNPAHLSAGTHEENMREMAKAGRASNGAKNRNG